MDGAPAAMIDGIPVSWEELRRPLAELAGAAAMTDAVLDRRLGEELTRRGLQLDESAIARERSLLAESLVGSGGAGSRAMIDDLRRARGLGPQRFEAFLRRNATLRLLVAGNVNVTEEMIRQRHEVRHGAKVRARVITVPTQTQAAALHARLAVADNLSMRFAEAAAAESTDESAPRGGLIEAISPADPAYETVVRRTLAGLAPGQLSPVVALEQGFGLFLMESQVPATGVSLASARGEIENELRRRQERLLMDTLAQSLLDMSGVTVFDPSLEWSWSRR